VQRGLYWKLYRLQYADGSTNEREAQLKSELQFSE